MSEEKKGVFHIPGKKRKKEKKDKKNKPKEKRKVKSLINKTESETEGPMTSARFHIPKEEKNKGYKRKNKSFKIIPIIAQKKSFHVSSEISAEKLKEIALLAKEIHIYAKSEEPPIPKRNEQEQKASKDLQSTEDIAKKFHETKIIESSQKEQSLNNVFTTFNNPNNVKNYNANIPVQVRLILSKYIYEIISKSKRITHKKLIENIYNSLRNKINFVNELSDLNYIKLISGLNNNDYKDFLSNYISDLILIVKKLIKYNEIFKNKYEPINISVIVNELVADNTTLGYARNSLIVYVVEIFDFLKSKFSNFELERITHQNLFDDGISKECGICHKIKPYSEFHTRITKRPYYYCTDCRNTLIAVRNF